MKFRDIPIKRKIMSAIMLICSVVLLLMCCAYLVFEYLSHKTTEKNNLSALGVVIASNSSAALAFESRQDAGEILNALKANKHITAACLYDKHGVLFAKYPADIAPNILPPRPGSDGYSFNKGFVDGFEPVIQKSDRLGTLFIRSDMDEMYDQLGHFLVIALVFIGGSLIVAWILSNVLQKIISEPILSLKETARIVSDEHNYSVRAIKMSNDELGSLTAAFNHMLSQIEAQNIEIISTQAESSKLAAIVESSSDAIVSMDLDGIFTSWNESAERIFGFKADEIGGQSVLNIIPPELHHEEFQILEKLRNGVRIEQFETQRLTKDKRLLDVSVSISPIKDKGGNIIGSSKITRDISEKKQEERRKNDFIAMVSHELKTPLTSMRSYIQVLLAKSRNEDDAFRTNALTRAEVQAKKMTNMIHDFLNLARLEEGKLQLNRELFDLVELVEEITSDARFLTSSHAIEFTGCTTVDVFADRDKIGQVLMNLLTNAIKYSPAGDKIIVSCEIFSNKVKVSVTDNGIGISGVEQKKLFDRFYRVKNEKLKTVSGFGIGLYLVSEILRYHGSKIEVNSTEGEGSVFSFVLDRRV